MYERNERGKLEKIKPESYICRYDESSKHKHCKHPQYCIFNKKRMELEADIAILEKEINQLTRLRNNLLNGEIVYFTEFKEDYEREDWFRLKRNVKNLLTVKRRELNDLIRFRNKVLDNEGDGYGYK